MSHFTIYETELQNVTEETVREAVEALAKELNATVVSSLESEYWRRERIVAGLKMPGLETGIGVRVVNGKMQIVGDDYRQAEQFARLQFLLPKAVEIQTIRNEAKKQMMMGHSKILGTRMRLTEKKLELAVMYA